MYGTLPVSMYQLKPLGLSQWDISASLKLLFYGHQQNEQNDRNNKCQITSMFSRIVFFLSFTLFCNQSLCVLFGEPFKNCGGWTSAPGTFETLIPANSSHQQYQFWRHVSIQLRHLMFGVLLNIIFSVGISSGCIRALGTDLNTHANRKKNGVSKWETPKSNQISH